MNIAATLCMPGTTRAECVPLGEIPTSWDRHWCDLAADASEPNPFAECWFTRAAIANLDCAPDDRLLSVWQSETLIGLIPLTGALRYGRIPVAHLQNWTHYHAFYGAPLVRAGRESDFWAPVLAHLDTATRAPNFLHLVGLDPSTPSFAALARARRCDIVHRSTRALLASGLTGQAYYETNVRKKKRKELARLRTRLEELGSVSCDRFHTGPVDQWIGEFLTLEASGWKGRDGSAMDTTPATRLFFTEVLRSAQKAGRLDMLRLSLDDTPIAMLVNFLTPPGSYSFKIAFDEHYARFSPGVLIQLENLATLDRREVAWMDSCATEDHPMINSLWAERREIVRVTIPLGGFKRRSVFHGARTIERAAAQLRGRA